MTVAIASDFLYKNLPDNQRWHALNETAIFFIFFAVNLVLAELGSVLGAQ